MKGAEAVLWSDSWGMQHICQGCCKLEIIRGAVLGMRERERRAEVVTLFCWTDF